MKLIKTNAHGFNELRKDQTIEDAKKVCLQHYAWDVACIIIEDFGPTLPTYMTFSPTCIVVELTIPFEEVKEACAEEYTRYLDISKGVVDAPIPEEDCAKLKELLEHDTPFVIHIVNLCGNNYFYYTIG